MEHNASANRIDTLLRLSKGLALDRKKRRIEIEEVRDALGCFLLKGRSSTIEAIENIGKAGAGATWGQIWERTRP